MVKIVLQSEFGVVLRPWMFGVTIIVIMSRHSVQKVFVLAINEKRPIEKENNNANRIIFVFLLFHIEITTEDKTGPWAININTSIRSLKCLLFIKNYLLPRKIGGTK